MIYILAVAGGLWLLLLIGRRQTHAARQRLARAFIAALAAVGAVAAGLRGAWVASALLVALSVVVGGFGRPRREPPIPHSAMSVAQARSILGVGPSADRSEIEQAYRRLIRRVHPDAGGAPGLAAQLNLAREVLLR